MYLEGSVDCRMGFGSSCHVLYYYVDVRATSSRVYCVGDVRSDGLRSSGYLSWGMGDVIEVCKKHSMASGKSVCFRAWMVECVAWEASWIQRPAVEEQKVRLGDLRREISKSLSGLKSVMGPWWVVRYSTFCYVVTSRARYEGP